MGCIGSLVRGVAVGEEAFFAQGGGEVLLEGLRKSMEGSGGDGDIKLLRKVTFLSKSLLQSPHTDSSSPLPHISPLNPLALQCLSQGYTKLVKDEEAEEESKSVSVGDYWMVGVWGEVGEERWENGDLREHLLALLSESNPTLDIELITLIMASVIPILERKNQMEEEEGYFSNEIEMLKVLF